jgi:tight adherence protein B
MSAVVVLGVLALAVLVRVARRATARQATQRHDRNTAGRIAFTSLGARWRARRHGVDSLSVVLEDIARAVRSGSSLHHACADAAAAGSDRVRTELADAVARATRGSPLATAFALWSRGHPSPDVRLAGAALSLAASAGGAQARVVDGAAATLRERRAVAGEVRAQSAQARLSALVIGLLPLAFLVWAVVTDGRTAAFLVADPVGWACLMAGVVLEVLGALWMRRILRSAAP